jgi:exodeoxyribonuclease III
MVRRQKNKGVGIFSYSNYKFKLLEEYNPDFKIVIPILVLNELTSFTLFAICANYHIDYCFV